MLKRLYVQIYLTIVVSLGIVVLIAAVLWRSGAEISPMKQALDLSGELAGTAVAPIDAPVATQQTQLTDLSRRLGTDLSLFDAQRQPIAASGRPMPPPPPDARGWMHTAGGPAWALNLPDGRWLIVRVPFAPRDPAVGTLLFIGSIALAVAVAGFPVARWLTRRLERLQTGVESLGRGDLAARVRVEGKDEIARLAASFNRAASRIEELVGAHRMLLANASHELRTPLARIRLGLELSGRDLAPDRKREIERDIAELDELIGEILLASRLDAVQNLDIEEDVDLLALAAEECARYPDCRLNGESANIAGDPRLLRRLIRNLLENAGRHGRPPVSVTLQRIATAVELAVRDGGPPIPAAYRDKLFTPFLRIRGPSGELGTGLGLALVRQIAERHGGTASYEDDVEGSCFRVRLPAVRARPS